jgi:hypothetical protein
LIHQYHAPQMPRCIVHGEFIGAGAGAGAALDAGPDHFLNRSQINGSLNCCVTSFEIYCCIHRKVLYALTHGSTDGGIDHFKHLLFLKTIQN